MRNIYLSGFLVSMAVGRAFAFQAEEATIESVQSAIRSGEITCKGVVEAYVARARAYNGVCTALVTADGASIKPVPGIVRAGKPLVFPTRTVKASALFPDMDKYQGMRVGIPDAGQINALETLNIRGERSVTCKGRFDAHPSTGLLPKDAPAVCEKFRQQPDAVERAAELDAQYGRNPDLRKLPMYCVVAAFKDPYDTRDMRTTSSNDVNFAMDVPPFDSTVVAELRAKGAIIHAKSAAHEFNGGSGAAIGGNLAMIGICEQSGASCQGPASRNGTALILTTRGIIPDNGGIGNQWFNDRAGIHARTLVDAAKVLDALKDPERGYHDPRDPFTALPRALIPEQPYASFLVGDAALKGGKKPLKGMRIAILREHMVKKTRNHEAISDQIDAEIKKVLRDQLGAELVETVTPRFPDDPSVPNLKYGFTDRYLIERGDSRVTDWAAWVANARFRQSSSDAGAKNWVLFKDHTAEGKAERLARSQVARMALQRVMYENRIDAFVHAENTVPTPKIQGPNVGTASLDGISPFFQVPRIAVPAGLSPLCPLSNQ